MMMMMMHTTRWLIELFRLTWEVTWEVGTQTEMALSAALTSSPPSTSWVSTHKHAQICNHPPTKCSASICPNPLTITHPPAGLIGGDGGKLLNEAANAVNFVAGPNSLLSGVNWPKIAEEADSGDYSGALVGVGTA